TNALMMKLGVSANTIAKGRLDVGMGSQLTQSQADAFYKATGAPGGPLAAAAKPTVNKDDLQKSISLQQQYIALLAQTATIEQQVKEVDLQVQAAQLQGVNLTKDEVANLKRLASERALGIDQIKANADGLRTETAAFGMDTGQAAAFTAVQTKINEARRLGVT